MPLADLERVIRQTMNRFGIDLHRYRPEQSGMGRLARMLSIHGIDIVLDVGANVGQFAMALRSAGYAQQIISFEPLSAAHAQLVRNSKRDRNWKVGPQVALGDSEGELTIHVSKNLVSSSALRMLDTHISAAPDSAYIENERVRVCTLDSIAPPYLSTSMAAFLKIDTQGYEQHVLNGAAESLERIKGIQLELSLVPLYDGQLLFDALVSRLTASGFSIWSIEPGFCDERNGRMLQVDATFFRS